MVEVALVSITCGRRTSAIAAALLVFVDSDVQHTLISIVIYR